MGACRRGRGVEDWHLRPRPTVKERERSDEIVLNVLMAVTCLGIVFGADVLCALMRIISSI